MALTADEFRTHRAACFAVAYRMVGSVADAEDIVQETWLRWATVERGEVANTEAYLVRIATRLALNKLRSLQHRRETYVGPWLPEPLVTTPDVADGTSLAESLSVAMLLVLESLSPLERAVFVLGEVFGYPHGELAGILDRSAASVRQLAHRAREHVQARRPRFDTDRSTQQQVTDRFLSACQGGNVQELMAVLAPEVTLTTDGGGQVRAARHPIHGADKVARFLTGSPRWLFTELACRSVELNGESGLLLSNERPGATITLGIACGRVIRIALVRNPDKLAGLSNPTDISRMEEM